MKKFIKDLLTHSDGITYDVSRVLCLSSFLVYFFLSFIVIFIDKPWSAIEFATGIGTMAIGFGLHFKLKQLPPS